MVDERHGTVPGLVGAPRVADSSAAGACRVVQQHTSF